MQPGFVTLRWLRSVWRKAKNNSRTALLLFSALRLRGSFVLDGAPAPNPGRCFALFNSLPAAPTAQAKVRGQQNRAILHNTHALCAMRGQEKRLLCFLFFKFLVFHKLTRFFFLFFLVYSLVYKSGRLCQPWLWGLLFSYFSGYSPIFRVCSPIFPVILLIFRLFTCKFIFGELPVLWENWS